MKFLKQFLILIVAFVCIFLVVALFVKKDYSVTRSIDIAKSKEDVFYYLKYLENHEEFTVWTEKDPKTVKTYTGEDGTVGLIHRWESSHKEVGIGEQEITKIIPDNEIEYELRFEKPYEMTANAYFKLSANSSQNTKVDWGFEGASPWPWNILLLFMDMDEMLGPDLENGLENLKNTIEIEE